MTGACEGAIAGLVGITPGAGYVSVWPAALIGYLTAIVCNSMSNVNEWIRIDEGMDVFKIHGIGGIIGSFLTGVFADSYVLQVGKASNVFKSLPLTPFGLGSVLTYMLRF